MQAALKRLDDKIADGEAKVATFVLLLMIAAAFMQALLQVLAKRMGLDFAQSALESIGNVDHFLQTATLWLAFLGASLATHANKHIAIDVLDKILPKGGKRVVKAVTYLVSGVVSILLTWIFVDVILKEGTILPAELATFGDAGEIHICDASDKILTENELSRPGFFCAVRSTFGALGVELQAPRPAFQLIVPLLFFVIAARFLIRGLRYAVGDPTLEGEEEAASAASRGEADDAADSESASEPSTEQSDDEKASEDDDKDAEDASDDGQDAEDESDDEKDATEGDEGEESDDESDKETSS